LNKTISIDIIDNNEDFIVINKAPNVNFHDEDELGKGLFNQVKQNCQATELYPVHRLDKMTSGLIIFAKTKVAAQVFGELFQQHQMEKYYIAISDKKPIKKQGLIKGDMAKSRRGMWKLLRTQLNPAISQFFSYGLNHGKRLYLIKPHSGKTHQIRVALSSIGSPILGDPSYYPRDIESNSKINETNKVESKIENEADRGYLHAYALRFRFNNTEYCYQLAPTYGDEFLSHTCQEKLAELGQPWQLNWPRI
jgi:tRNA pseudouridine32 synthase/23S rRNA pseudouridine746 synthase